MKIVVGYFLALTFLLPFGSQAQSRFWLPLSKQVIVQKEGAFNELESYKAYRIDRESFRNYLLENCPFENTGSSLEVMIPYPDGSFKSFALVESPSMESGLMAKFPNIKSYRGHNGADYLRMAVSPHSLNIYILTGKGDVVIEAISHQNASYYGVYYGHQIPVLDGDPRVKCGTTDNATQTEGIGEFPAPFGKQSFAGGDPVMIRTFRVAISCTGDWGKNDDLGGGTVEKCIDKINASLAYINAVYEKDAAIHLNLVNNNDRLIYLDPARDPFAVPTVGGELLGVNTDVINRQIGSGFYDIGHVYTIGCSDVGGIASLASVCGLGKGAGVTCWYASDIAYVSQRITCHEMGHQFAAPHTFSNCNGNESFGTAYEPGSGTTIMSYSGLCGPDLNVEPNALPHPNYFHVHSVQTIINFTRGAGSTGASCGTTENSGNTYPVPEILIEEGLTLPSRTPFLLKGMATDMENDPMTYNWEQYDAGPYGGALGQPTSTGPLIKSVFPGPSPDRVIPDWAFIYGTQNYNKTEILPFETRKLTFRFTVRDNHPGAGGAAWDQIQFNVDGNSGPFRVTSPNTTGLTIGKNSCFKVKWDVSNTYFEPVNCKKVNILLFKNRNHNAPIVLKSNTDNDGEELVTIPDGPDDTRSRICIQAADHIFFDVSDFDFRILGTAPSSFDMAVSPSLLRVCAPAIVNFDIQSCSNNGLAGNLNLSIEEGLPPGASYRFEKTSIDFNDQTKLVLDMSQVKTGGNYTLKIVGDDGSGNKINTSVKLEVVGFDFSDLALLYPPDGLSGAPQGISFTWKKSINALSYTFELATSPAFGNSIVYRQTGLAIDSLRTTFLLDQNKLYYWRVIPVNICGEGQAGLPNAFHTISKSCNNAPYPGNTIRVFRNETKNMEVFIPNSGNVSDVNIKDLNGNANFVNNIRLTLISPKGTRVLLWNYNCSNSDIFECSFDDEGLVRASVACPPSGKAVIIPQQSLKALVGEDRKGIWILEVNANSRLTNAGSNFFSFGLEICSDIVLNSPELLINNPLNLNNAETKNISEQLLLCQDKDNSANELLYTMVSKTAHGDILLDGAILAVGSQFTQEDINTGRLRYRHHGNGGKTDGFNFTIIDGKGGWIGTEYFTINIEGVSTKNPQEAFDVNLYPNPVGQGTLYVEWQSNQPGDMEFQIRDMQGRSLLIKQNVRDQKFNINTSQLLPGIYLAELRQGSQKVLRKIIVQ